MKIYVDVIFMINLIYDFLILNSVNVILKRNINIKRILLGSFIGSISAFSLFIPFLNNVFVTILLSIIMILVTFGFKDIIYVKNNILYFYLVSIIFGGFIFLIDLKFNNSYDVFDSYNKRILINFIGIVILSPLVYFLYLYSYKSYSYKYSNYYDINFSFTDKLYKVKGFYDSGNLIKDPYKGRPVILIDKNILYGDIKNKSPIIVPCHMINNLVLIDCYKPNLLIINNKVINNCLIGLWENNNFYDDIKGIISGYIGDKIK